MKVCSVIILIYVERKKRKALHGGTNGSVKNLLHCTNSTVSGIIYLHTMTILQHRKNSKTQLQLFPKPKLLLLIVLNH